jgi:hypothetical protein
MRQKDRRDTEEKLLDFGKSCLKLCDVLRQGTELSDEQRLFVDNHIQLLHLHYAKWKNRKHKV